jgi:hypothetical protein
MENSLRAKRQNEQHEPPASDKNRQQPAEKAAKRTIAASD